ncbi:hypothetical protein EV361DRAFT_965086 [Lentinula raphanica]|nr:hypothetical protein EV361DRAFT_965086 [Lentinula raphanica]
MLPEEILDDIVHYLAYNPNLVERELLIPPRKYHAITLLPLSVANRQFRRICLQFLFAHIEVRRVGELERLQSQCLESRSFSSCIRTLDIASATVQEDYELILQILPSLPNLLWLVVTTRRMDATLIRAIQRHPSATIVTSLWCLPDGLEHLDLRKVTLRTFHWHGDDKQREGRVYRLLDHGMQSKRLIITDPHFLKESFGDRKYPGLLKLELEMGLLHIDMSWCGRFFSAHPLLRKISFTDFHRMYFQTKTAFMFIDPFLQAIAQQNLSAAIQLRGFAVTRDVSMSNSERSSQWRVTGLFLTILDSMEQVLRLAHPLLPDISTLTIDRMPCTLDKLIASLRPFASLTIVNLLNTFQSLDFGSEKPWQDPSIVEVYDGTLIGPVATEFSMIWFTSRIAKAIPSIQAFYIDEESRNGPGKTGGNWRLRGWIFVRDMQLNNPIQLQIYPPHKRPGWHSGWHPDSSLSSLKYCKTTFFV